MSKSKSYENNIKEYPVWFKNRLFEKREVSIKFYSAGPQYGINVFEGILSVNIYNKNYIFRLDDHIKRLERSSKNLSIVPDINFKDIKEKVINYIKLINPSQDCNIRVSIFPKEGSWSSAILEGNLLISAFTTTSQLLGNNLNPLKLKISKIKKTSKLSIDQSLKVGANYLNSRYAQLDAIKEGYDSCLLLDDENNITESGGSNIFFIKDEKLYTPPITQNILNGITRDSIIKLAKYNNIEVCESKIKSSDIINYQSAFLCGTAMRTKAIKKIDNKNFYLDNKLMKKITELYSSNLITPSSELGWHTEV